MNDSRKGALVLLLSTFFFAAMSLAAKDLMGSYPASEVTFFRMSVGGVFCITAFLTGAARFHVTRMSVLATRGMLGGLAVFFYFQTVGLLNAGEATLINNTNVVFIALLSPLLLKEKVRWQVYMGIGAGLAGVAIVVGAGFSTEPFGKITGLFAALFTALAIMTIKNLRQDHGSIMIFFAFCIGGTVVSMFGAMQGGWLVPRDYDLLLMILMGLFSTGGQVLFTWAMKHTNPLDTSVSSQLTVLWIYSWQIFVWGEKLTLFYAIGAAIIIAACVYLGTVLGTGGKKGDRKTIAPEDIDI
ncbi:MAG: DMT family transporter [Myxococcota bacterium]|jgi:drug/metabolite transporter (DMT)-like permease